METLLKQRTLHLCQAKQVNSILTLNTIHVNCVIHFGHRSYVHRFFLIHFKLSSHLKSINWTVFLLLTNLIPFFTCVEPKNANIGSKSKPVKVMPIPTHQSARLHKLKDLFTFSAVLETLYFNVNQISIFLYPAVHLDPVIDDTTVQGTDDNKTMSDDVSGKFIHPQSPYYILRNKTNVWYPHCQQFRSSCSLW